MDRTQTRGYHRVIQVASGGHVASQALHRRLSRRSLLKWSALGAFAVAASGCQVIPGLAPKAKLNVWTDATFAPGSDDYQTQEIEAWAKNRGHEVEVTREGGGNVQTKLQAALESKQLPDISQVDSGRYTRFHPTKSLTDVSDLFGEIGKQWGGWYQISQQVVTKDGKQYALPYSIDSSLLLYWNDVLREGGVREFPAESWRAMVDTMKRLMKPPDLYGIGFQFNKAGTDSENTFGVWALAHGASLQKQDSRTLSIKTPEMKSFLEELKWSWDQGVYPPGTTGWDNAGNNTALQDKKAIVIHNPASPLVWFRNNKPDSLQHIGVSASPKGKDGKSYNIAYLRDGFAVMATGNDAGIAASRDLLKHLYSKDVYRKWIEIAFPAPALNGLEDMEIWKNPQRKGFLDAAKGGVRDGYPGEQTPAYAELQTRTPWLTMATRMIVDKWTPDQAMDELDKIAVDVYSKHFK